MKPWKTVLEDQTLKAQVQIKHLLAKEGSESNSKKGVAIAMAVVGIALIGIGIFPFFSSPGGDSLKADLNLDAVLPAFDEDPATVDSVNFNPDPISVVVDEKPIETINDNIATPITDIVTDPIVDPITEIGEIDLPVITSPLVTKDENINATTENNQTPFRVNTHTNTTVEDEIIDNSSQEEVKSSSQTTKENDENLHSAAPKTVKTGPEMWLIAIFSVVAAFFVRRKSQLSLRI